MDVLRAYLRTHWAASAAGVDLADRVANRHHQCSDVGGILDSVASDVRTDRSLLRDLMRELDVRPGAVGPLAAHGAERVGRLKPNGRLVRRSPVSDLLEVEVLRSAVVAKRAAWEALETLADDDRRAASPALAALPRLRERADSQVHRLSLAHGALSRRVLGAPDPIESSSCSNGVSHSMGADHDDSPADAGEELLDDRDG